MLYKNIEMMCKKKGISITALEKEAGLGNGAIGKWKNSVPGVGNLKKVANILGCKVDELLEES